jgi:hypothetical protein
MIMSMECCVPGCGHDRAPDFPRCTREGACAEHFSLAAPQARRLLHSAARRLACLQRSWDDEEVFEAIAVRGRYLAFCALLESAHDRVDRAWERVRSEILATAGDLKLGSPGIAPVTDLSDRRLEPASGSLHRKARISSAPQE